MQSSVYYCPFSESDRIMYHMVELKQEGQHPLTGQCATNFRLLANQ